MCSQEENAAPSLLADAMLGKLARWLRLLGYDTLYLQVDDALLAHRARSEGRILLTRDRELVKRRGLHFLLISSEILEEQLVQVLQAVGPPPEPAGPRCMECNTPLREIPLAEARSQVPIYVAQTQTEFRQCPTCQRITWPGTHWDGIQQRLERVRDQLAGSK
ncbi:MAG: Mut7-C RNAse domain-containing protein [Chloroflexota bacterium]|nr:Mut7-C RNAse domain-containing protein [Chloroflexota bacterium]